jgi:hypothetical protein
MEEFRLGIQKCRKTIRDGIRSGDVFKGDGTEVIFKWVSGFWCRIFGSGFLVRISGPDFRFRISISGSGFPVPVPDFRFWISGARFPVPDFRFLISGFRFPVPGFRL